ncbi:hypothetical protein MRB53_027421 [Persea americana]|uniref:Uncharacterized protein n=1 Tax=Persea americana TaxID=3435 RepID=A0ACC2LLD0_PERAE|nr:hypothetical protein MRB53_027421 [Persea americana]
MLHLQNSPATTKSIPGKVTNLSPSQEQEELILRLKQQLQDKRAPSPPPVLSRASGPPPKHGQAPTHERDLRHVLNNKKRDRVHGEKDSSSSHVHEGPKKQRQIPEDEKELKQIKQTISQNMETAGASPFFRDIRKYSLPEKLNVPKFTLYDRTSDPAAHLRYFVQRMSVWGDDDFLNCRVFSSSLEDLSLRWFCSLPEGSISSWRQLRTSFLDKFQAHRVIPKTDADLMALRM